MAEGEGFSRRLEVLDMTQFLVANMLEWTDFDGNQRRHTFIDLAARPGSSRCLTRQLSNRDNKNP